ncbi:MAG: MoaD/ThiS family protein [Phycisphaerae bacterium]|nr:MoaD/ThiS family protein [Phycisphaerae bacterium]
MIRVTLPFHLQTLAGTEREITIELTPPFTQRRLLDALEARYPALCGTIRHHGSPQRRALVRFFACQQDLSHEPPDAPLPDPVVRGIEPFMIVGAIAGG